MQRRRAGFFTESQFLPSNGPCIAVLVPTLQSNPPSKPRRHPSPPPPSPPPPPSSTSTPPPHSSNPPSPPYHTQTTLHLIQLSTAHASRNRTMTSLGYQNIDSASGAGLPNPHDATLSAPPNNNLQDKATAAAIATRNAMTDIIHAPMPDINLYTEPINPNAHLTLNDRLQLILESCRPWPEFADFSSFNLPAPSELKLRLGHNFEIFFYNYLVIAFAILALTALFHPLRAVLVAGISLVSVLMYVIFPEDYVIGDALVINKLAKNCILVALLLFAVVVAHVLSLFLSFAFFFFPVVMLHSLLREHSSVSISTI